MGLYMYRVRTYETDLRVWTRAACGWHDLQGAKIAHFGDNMRDVAVTEGDKVEAQIRMGYDVYGYGVGDLVEAVSQVTDAAVDNLVTDYLDEPLPLLVRLGQTHAGIAPDFEESFVG